MSGFTDIHAHFIYGVDDGAKTREDMETMIDAAYADGVGTLVATPHQTPGVKPFAKSLFQQRVKEAREYCFQKQYDLEIYTGSELLYTPLLNQYSRENELQTYQGRSYILIEFVPSVSYREIDEALTNLKQQGYQIVVAHIERYECLAKRNAYRLKDKHDVKFQMNCSTVIDSKGFIKDQKIRQWLKDQLIDAIATDSHDCRRRPTRMTEAYNVIAAEVNSMYARKVTGKR